MDGPDLGWIHLQTFFQKNEAKVLDGVSGEMTFVRTGIETMFLETTENLTDMFLVFCRVVEVDEDVIKVDGNIYVQKVTKNVVHESLESGWGIG